jgi:hypothetical protein
MEGIHVDTCLSMRLLLSRKREMPKGSYFAGTRPLYRLQPPFGELQSWPPTLQRLFSEQLQFRSAETSRNISRAKFHDWRSGMRQIAPYRMDTLNPQPGPALVPRWHPARSPYDHVVSSNHSPIS